MSDETTIKRAADRMTAHVDAYIATVKFPDDATRRRSVIVVLDGADDGAQAIYSELRKAAPPGELPNQPIPRDQLQTVVCPYDRLKKCAGSAGYALGDKQDKDPAGRDVRVATFTAGGAVVATYTLVHPVGQA